MIEGLDVLEDSQSENDNECSMLCGKPATGILRLAYKINSALCDNCRENLDRAHDFEFTPLHSGPDVNN